MPLDFPSVQVIDARPDRTGWPAVEATHRGLPATHPACRCDWCDPKHYEVMLRCGGLGPDATPEQLREWARDSFTVFETGIDCAILPTPADGAGARIRPCRSGWCGFPDYPRSPYFHLVSIRLVPRLEKP